MIKRTLCMLLLFAVSMHAQDEAEKKEEAKKEEPKDVIAWVGTTERVLPASGTVEIRMTLAPGLAQITPEVRQVTLDGEAIDPVITASWADSKLKLTADAARTKKAGTYVASLHFPAPDEKYKERSLEVKLVRRAGIAAFTMPTPLRFERITTLGSPTWSPSAHYVSLNPNAPAPAKSKWSVTLNSSATDPGGQVMHVELEPSETQLAIKPSGADSYPFGTISGKVTINDPQLAAPAEVTVEVLSRLWKGWLFLVIVVSIVIGHYTRKYLEARRALATARLAGAGVRKDLDALRGVVAGDAAFAKRVREQQTKITDVMRGEDPEAITKAVTAATAEITKIRADYDKAVKDTRDLVRKLRETIGNPDSKRRQMGEAAKEIAAQLDAVDADLVAGRVSGELEKAQAIEAAIPEKTRLALIAWSTPLRALIAELSQWPAIDKAAMKVLGEKIAALTAEDLDKAKEAFAATAEIDAAVEAHVRSLGQEVDPMDPPAATATLREIREQMTEEDLLGEGKEGAPPVEVKPAGIAPAFDAEIVIDGTPIVGEPLRLAFRVTRNGEPVPNIVIVQWFDGADYLGTGVAFDYKPHSTEPVVIRARTTVDGQSIERSERIAPAADFIYDVDRLMSDIRRVNWVQTGVAGAFIAFVGYVMFNKSFVGPLDLVMPALWGFATDLTLAKVLEYAEPATAKKLEMKEAAAPAAPVAPVPEAEPAE